MNKLFNTKNMVLMALVAALYVVLTLMFQPVSYGIIQFRISEVLTILAFFNPIYIIAVTLGVIISNLFSPLGMYDMILGPMHTLISIYFIWKIRNIWVASLMPALFSFIIAIIIALSAGTFEGFLINYAYIAASEFVIVTLIAVPLALFLIKSGFYKKLIPQNFDKVKETSKEV